MGDRSDSMGGAPVIVGPDPGLDEARRRQAELAVRKARLRVQLDEKRGLKTPPKIEKLASADIVVVGGRPGSPSLRDVKDGKVSVPEQEQFQTVLEEWRQLASSHAEPLVVGLHLSASDQ